MIGRPDVASESTAVTPFLNPLHVNAMLNALKKGGAAEIHYWGQPIFSGQEDERDGKEYVKQQFNPPAVKLVLQPRILIAISLMIRTVGR